jgi:hypothetical protein
MATSAAKSAGSKFEELNTKLVYTPKTSEGKGFLPPFLRALTHITYGLGIAEDELPKTKTGSATEDKKIKETMTKVKEELTGAISHFEKVEVTDAFSSVAQDQLMIFKKALGAASAEFENWDRDTQINNLTALVNKLLGISAMLDRELIGLRDSDPGSNL